MQGLTKEVTLRPRSGRILAVAIVVIAALGLTGVLATGQTDLIARGIPALGFLGFGAWAVFWRPAVRIGPAELVFINPLKTVAATWPAIEEVQTRWSLAIVTADGVHTAWAAPRPTRVAGALGVRRDARGRPDFAAEQRRQQEAGRATGDVAAYLVTTQWNQYRDQGLLGTAEGSGTVTRWHVTTVLVLIGLVVAWVVALALP